MTEFGAVVPVYVVVDESASMWPANDALNDGVRDIVDGLALEPFASSRVRLTVVGFADEAICYVHLADVLKTTDVPMMRAQGSTSYSAALRYLQDELAIDVESLAAEGYRVHRPLVFFLTDGMPNQDGWLAILADLRSSRVDPMLVAFGLPGASVEVLRTIASDPSLVFVADAAEPARLLRAFFQSIVKSIAYTTTASLVTSSPRLILDIPEGFSRSNTESDG